MLANAPADAPPPPVPPDGTSLFLDFDGTLVELAPRPDAVFVDGALEALLAQLATRLGGRVAVVSGRSVAQLEALLGTAAPNLSLVGSHGAEVRAPGTAVVAPERPAALREAEALFTDAFAARAGVLIEVKTLGVAIHYRLDPSAEAEANRLAQAFAAGNALDVQEGKMMVELRAPGHDKGSGIAGLMARTPFAGHRPLFLGDDVTDEPGFARCAEMGGAGVLVGAPRPTAASYRLPDVAAVHAWLGAL